jgi:hypothetical protein
MLKSGGFMDTIAIVSEIDAEISRLQQVKQLLTAVKATEKRKPGRPSAAGLTAPTKTTRTLSDASRENIAAAQKKRWAKVRRAKKAALNAAPASTAKKAAPKTSKTVPAKKATAIKKSVPAKPKVAAASPAQPAEK